MLWHAKVYKQFGRLLKYAIRLQDERPSKELEEKIIELYKLNEWEYLASHFLRNLPSKFPSAYRPF
jgi:tripeptidyl-peptidase-2